MSSNVAAAAAQRLPIVVLISGRGSNMRVIAEHARRDILPVDVRAVISDQPAAPGLDIARELGIPTRSVRPRDYPDRASFDAALADVISEYAPKLIVLAGYMRILSPVFVQRFAGRMLNIHPSLLPKHRGLHTHQRVLDAGEHEHGVSVHFVTEELDGGPVVLQAVIDVEARDTADTLSARIQQFEHRIYPQVIAWFAQDRLQLRNNEAWLDGERLLQPRVLDARTTMSGAT